MAGGTMVLGGAIAGPVIAVMGFSAAKQSEKALTKAFAQASEVAEATFQVENGIVVLDSISTRASEIQNVIAALAGRFVGVISEAEDILAE